MPDLDELNRQRLDGIITKAVANGESEDTIKAIVQDYKGKYTAPSTFKQRELTQGAKGSPRPDYVNIGGESPYQGLTRTTMGEPLANAAPTLASMAAPEGGVLSTGAGIGIKTLLQKIAPNLFGQSQTPIEDAGKDLLFNNGLPTVVGKGLEFAGDPRGTTARAIATKIPGTNIRPIADISPSIQRGLAEDTINQATTSAAKRVFSKTDILDVASTNAKDLATSRYGSATLAPAADPITNALVKGQKKAIDFSKFSVDDVRNFQMATGEPTSVSQLAINDLLGQSRAGTLDPESIIAKMNGPKADVYKEALGPAAQSRINSLLDTIKEAKDSMPKSHILFPYEKRLAIGALTTPVAGFGAGATVTGTLIFGEMALKKVMSDPAMAELVTRAIKTPSAAPEASLLTKSILQGLKGTTLTLRQKDDKDITVNVDENGQVQYGKPR